MSLPARERGLKCPESSLSKYSQIFWNPVSAGVPTYGDATKTNTNEISRVSCEEQSEGAIPSKNEIATPSGLAMTVTIFTSLVIIQIERTIMAKIGSKKKPAVARVQTEKRAGEIMQICNERGWQVIVGIEPDKPEDISDIKWLLKNFEKQPIPQIRSGPIKVSPNDYYPCGSGLKYKKCCFDMGMTRRL